MKKENRSQKMRIVGVLGAMIAASTLFAQTATRLQVLVTSDRAKAEQAVKQLDGAGAGPAEVRQVDRVFKVVTRSYGSLAEANFAKPAIKGRGFPDAFAVSDEQVKDRGLTGESKAPLEKLSVTSQLSFDQAKFDFTVAAPPRRFGQSTPELEALDNESAPESKLLEKAMARHGKDKADVAIGALEAFARRFANSPDAPRAMLMKGYWLDAKGDSAAAYAQFELVAASCAGKPEAGEATLRMGYLLIRQSRHGDALQKFYSVAAGNIPASEDVRVEAILRTAALYHRGRDLDAAMQAYDVIAKGASSREARAFAEMQQAALTLEKAWNSKATFSQARKKCDDVVKHYPGANKSIRATAALMALETLAYEGQHEEILKREKDFLNEFENTEEATLGFYWLAKARYETGDAEGAAGILDTFISAKMTSSKRFKDVEVLSQARRLAAKANEKLGNREKAKALLDMNRQ